MKPGSKKWKLFMGKLYGFGAAVVIVGALFKIQHWPFAGEMLIVGLSTEALIFIFSSFEPPHEDPEWTLVYPELAHGSSDGHGHHEAIEDKATEEIAEDSSITEQLDAMLEEAKIEPELLESLGTGLRSLSDNASKLSNISDASVATNDYVDSLKNASSRIGELSNNYEKASDVIAGMAEGAGDSQTVGESLTKVSANLSQLNNVYELQLKGASEHLEASNELYQGIDEMMKNLHDSLDDTRRYKQSMGELSQNLTALNTVYGNMLNAMNMGNPGANNG
jgi:gliding motility-associated protein GldL